MRVSHIEKRVTEASLRVGLAITYELYCCWLSLIGSVGGYSVFDGGKRCSWAIVVWKCWGL